MIHENLLRYRRGKYAWWFFWTVLAATALYMTEGYGRPASGSTWQGYVLGTVGTALIIWLAMMGIRKRQYSSTLGTVPGWASAHVYLGTALLVIATLHCALQFGFNLHTLAYVLMCVVIMSGFFGVYVYLALPQLLTDNHSGGNRSELFAELFSLDRRLRSLSKRTNPDIQTAVISSIERTAVGGDWLAQLSGSDHSWYVGSSVASSSDSQLLPNEDQQAVIDFVAKRLPRADKAAEVPMLHELVVHLCRRQAVLRRIRRDIRLRAWLQIWLYVHIPMTVALLVALVLHILSTFFYW
jgi:hypothetical protein